MGLLCLRKAQVGWGELTSLLLGLSSASPNLATLVQCCPIFPIHLSPMSCFSNPVSFPWVFGLPISPLTQCYIYLSFLPVRALPTFPIFSSNTPTSGHCSQVLSIFHLISPLIFALIASFLTPDLPLHLPSLSLFPV